MNKFLSILTIIASTSFAHASTEAKVYDLPVGSKIQIGNSVEFGARQTSKKIGELGKNTAYFLECSLGLSNQFETGLILDGPITFETTEKAQGRLVSVDWDLFHDNIEVTYHGVSNKKDLTTFTCVLPGGDFSDFYAKLSSVETLNILLKQVKGRVSVPTKDKPAPMHE